MCPRSDETPPGLEPSQLCELLSVRGGGPLRLSLFVRPAFGAAEPFAVLHFFPDGRVLVLDLRREGPVADRTSPPFFLSVAGAAIAAPTPEPSTIESAVRVERSPPIWRELDLPPLLHEEKGEPFAAPIASPGWAVAPAALPEEEEGFNLEVFELSQWDGAPAAVPAPAPAPAPAAVPVPTPASAPVATPFVANEDEDEAALVFASLATDEDDILDDYPAAAAPPSRAAQPVRPVPIPIAAPAPYPPGGAPPGDDLDFEIVVAPTSKPSSPGLPPSARPAPIAVAGPSQRPAPRAPERRPPETPRPARPTSPLAPPPRSPTASPREEKPPVPTPRPRPQPARVASIFTTPRRSARSSEPQVVAMDFGTTRSSVAVAQEDGEVEVLKMPGGRRDVHSIVAFAKDGTASIGDEARARLLADPACAVSSPKRILGRLFTDRDIEPHLAALAVKSSKGEDGLVRLHVGGRARTVPEVCAPLLEALRRAAEAHLGHEVKRAVLTVPVGTDDLRTRALSEAARLGGIEEAIFVEEPAAAALAYGFDRDYRGRVAVYDFGGGTFDFSLVEVTEARLDILTTAGDSWLGGDDFDEALAGAAANAFWRQHGVELRNQVVEWQRLLFAAEAAKRELSGAEQSTIRLAGAANTARGPLDLAFPLTQAQLAELCAPLIERSLDTCREALSLSDVLPDELSAVYLSGGTCYIPAVRAAVAAFLGRPPRISVPPERAVVIGAALYGDRILRKH
jgi:actin-like ATPase involved in cell morphogenesis